MKDGSERQSIWRPASDTYFLIYSKTLKAINQMLSKEIHTDVTITTSDSSPVRAHRAILAARSIVFDKMFTHNMRETLTSTINMMDMTLKECQALLSYVYGNLQHKDIEENAYALLNAAVKYDMADLKHVCKVYLMEDINTTNVLSRLWVASDYELHELKRECKRYLLDFGKIWEMKEEVSKFILESKRHADNELGAELVMELITRISCAAFQSWPSGDSGLEPPAERRAL